MNRPVRESVRSARRATASELVVRPIGVVHSPFLERASAPRQSAVSDARGLIELFPDSGFEHALADIETWSHLWVLFWFHLNEGFRPKVLPPRSARRRGVFSTRSPHRPNPIGLSAVKLEGVNGLVLEVSGLDILDQTPVLDLKPYVAYTDAISDAGNGWLAGALDPLAPFAVEFSDTARAELAWLRETWNVELDVPIRDVLALGPQAHPYRRIRRERAIPPNASDVFVLAVKEWRARFSVDGSRITVLGLRTGYRPRELALNLDGSLDAHRAFVARFGA
jgi:tRNA-Thr(GGU) m(6)t(6)A37 methyltransferase TsaA